MSRRSDWIKEFGSNFNADTKLFSPSPTLQLIRRNCRIFLPPHLANKLTLWQLAAKFISTLWYISRVFCDGPHLIITSNCPYNYQNILFKFASIKTYIIELAKYILIKKWLLDTFLHINTQCNLSEACSSINPNNLRHQKQVSKIDLWWCHKQ